MTRTDQHEDAIGPEAQAPADAPAAPPADGGHAGAGAPPAPRSFRWRNIVNWLTAAIFLVSAVVTFSLLALSAFDVRPIPIVEVLFLPAFLVVMAVHGLAAALLVAAAIEIRHPRWTDIVTIGHIILGLAILVVVPATVFFDWWVISQSLAPIALGLFIGSAVLGIVVAVGLVYLTWSPHHCPGDDARFPVYFLAGIGGVVAPTLLVGLLLIGSAFVRNVGGEPDVAQPPAVKLSADHRGYVAFGDSYSAGEGLPKFLPGTGDAKANDGNGCHRSGLAYSGWLEQAAVLPPLRFVVCSGAVTGDLDRGFDVTQADGTVLQVAPQLDGGTHPDVGLVTMTLGGNDVLFSRIVQHCLEKDGCMDATFTPPDWSHKTYDYPAPAPLGEWAVTDAITLRPHIEQVYGQLRTVYPNARIVIIGYPYLLPDGGGGFHLDDCSSILRRFSEDERTKLRTLQDLFNDMLYEEAVEAGIDYVSPEAVWDGHEACGSNGQYTNSLKPIFSEDVLDGGSFHPNQAGQKALGRLVACYLQANPSAAPRPFVAGSTTPFADDVLLPAGSVGLKDAPGSEDNPVPCDG